eukprot:364937-Chlamydomonas_euryale.AAC.15
MGRAQLFILGGSPDGRGPPAGGPRPASRDPSRDHRRKRDLSCERRATVAESATRQRPQDLRHPTHGPEEPEPCYLVRRSHRRSRSSRRSHGRTAASPSQRRPHCRRTSGGTPRTEQLPPGAAPAAAVTISVREMNRTIVGGKRRERDDGSSSAAANAAARGPNPAGTLVSRIRRRAAAFGPR